MIMSPGNRLRSSASLESMLSMSTASHHIPTPFHACRKTPQAHPVQRFRAVHIYLEASQWRDQGPATSATEEPEKKWHSRLRTYRLQYAWTSRAEMAAWTRAFIRRASSAE